MDRINGANTVDIGGGRRGFRSEDLANGLVGTEVTDLWLNMVQEELMKVIEDEGFIPAPDDWTQLSKALARSGRRSDFAIAGGTGDAIVATLSPAPKAYFVGMAMFLQISAANTGAVTIDVNGLGAKQVRPLAAAAQFVGGELKPTMVVRLVYDGAVFIAMSVAASQSNRGILSLAEVKQTSGDAFKQASTRIQAIRAPLVPSLVNNVMTIIPTTAFADDGQGDWEIQGSKIVCMKPGRFAFFVAIGMNMTGTNIGVAAGTLGVYLNGNEFINPSSRLTTETLNTIYGGGADIKDVIAGDYLEFRAFVSGSNAGSTLNYRGSASILRLAS